MKKPLFALFGFLLLAAPAAMQAQFNYMTNADGVTISITGYTGLGGVVTIPTNINGLPVIGINGNAFYTLSNVTSITIPASVTFIGSGAFSYCENLASITIPGSVTNIEVSAFQGCYSLTSVAIPGSVASLAEGLFSYCVSLTNVTISNGVTNIGPDAFASCTSLVGVTLPASLTSIGEVAFGDCTSLASVTIPGGVTSIGRDGFSGTGLTRDRPQTRQKLNEHGAALKVFWIRRRRIGRAGGKQNTDLIRRGLSDRART